MAQAASTECSNGEISPIESNPSLDVDARPITSFAHGDSEVHEAYPNATDDSRRSIDSPGGHSCSISKGSMKYVETTASTCSGHEMNENNVGDAGSRFDHIRTYFKRADGYTWTTAFIRDGPLLGIAALLFVLLSIPAAAIVLAVSDGQAVEKWKVQPNVFLSIFTGIGNKALAFAAAEGAIVTWWVRALHGTTLRNLHYDWAAGTNIMGSLCVKRVGILTATSLCAMIILVDGILLQSATKIVQRSLSVPMKLHAKLPQEVPTNFTGIAAKLDYRNKFMQSTFNEGFAPIWRDWGDRSPIPCPIKGCPGTCNTTVRAPAFALKECEETSTAFMNLTAIAVANGSESAYPSICEAQDDGTHWCPVLLISIAPSAAAIPREQMLVAIGMIGPEVGENNEGNFTRRTCTLDPAVAEYAVTVHGSEGVQVNTADPKILFLANNTAHQPSDPFEYINSTLGGIAALADMAYHSNVLMRIRQDAAWLNSPGPFQQSLIENPDLFYDMSKQNPPTLRDPSSEIFAGLNELMFRSAVLAATEMDQNDLNRLQDPGLLTQYDVDGTRIDAQPVFYTRWAFFCGAAAVQITCVALVTITYWKYWTIGRTSSFSPLEIAKAFDAPLLRNIPPNLRARRLAEKLGSRRVKYGLVGTKTEKGCVQESMRLLFDEEDRAAQPWDGCVTSK